MPTVTCSWTVPDDGGSAITSYVVQRRVGTGVWSALATVEAGSTSYSDSAAASATQYGYRVAVTNAVGTGAFSDEQTITTSGSSTTSSAVRGYRVRATDTSVSVDGSGAAQSVCLPSDATAAIATGTAVTITRSGTAALTIVPEVGVGLSSSTGTWDVVSGGQVTATKVAANAWSLSGSGLRTPLRTFYVDSVAGSDANSGTSTSAPWKTLTKVNSAAFQPGDAILLKCGSAFTHDGVNQAALRLTESGTATDPIWIGTYSTGPKPSINGAHATWGAYSWGVGVADHTHVQDLYVHDAGECGVYGGGGSSARGVEVNTSGVGVLFAGASSRALGCYVHDLKMVTNANTASDYGAIAFWIRNTDCEIAWSSAVNARAASTFHVHDGGVVRGEGCARLMVHNTSTRNCQGIYRAADKDGRNCNDVVFAFNSLVEPHGGWLGPSTATGVRLEHNSYAVQTATDGFRVLDGNAASYSIRNNIFYTNLQVADSAPSVHTHNIFFLMATMASGAGVGFTLGTGESTGDPLFVDRLNGNLRLQATSPALSAGTDLGWEVGATPNLGAYV